MTMKRATLSRRVITDIPQPVSASSSNYQQYTGYDEDVNFLEVRRAASELAANGLWASPELVRVMVGKMMNLADLKNALTELGYLEEPNKP